MRFLVSEREILFGQRPISNLDGCLSYLFFLYFMCLLHSCLLKTGFMMQPLEGKIIRKVNVVPSFLDLIQKQGNTIAHLCQDLGRKDFQLSWSVSGVLT